MSWKQGIIVIDLDTVIAHPGMLLDELLARDFAKVTNLERAGSGAHDRIFVGPISVSGHECRLALYFTLDRLTEVNIVVTENTAHHLGFTSGYASSPEGAEVRFLREWIRRETESEPPLNFVWGSIGDVYDTKANFARILFKYK